MQTGCRLYVYAPLAPGAPVALEGNDAHYLLHVMRAKAGMQVTLFNGVDGAWSAEITDSSRKMVQLRVQEQQCKQVTVPNMVVCYAPIKGNRMDGLIEKATELGAQALQPVITARSIVRKVNEARVQALMKEAAEQSERLCVPTFRPPVSLPQLLANWPNEMPLIYGDESGASASTGLEALLPAAKQHGWGILIGPEGGFAPEEFAQLQAAKCCHGVGLGPRILRAETACSSLCSITMNLFGDWHERPSFKHP